jgi:uncharacterized membrane protein YhaH (DUF805 family)
MSFADAIRTCFSKYATFSGRARRSEFWYFVLLTFIVGVVLGIVAAVLMAGSIASDSEALASGMTSLPAGVMVVYGIAAVFNLAVLLPFLAVSVRRLHDTDRSGGFWFLNLIPFVGGIIVLVFYCLAGTVGPNRFGADPKGAPVAAGAPARVNA